MEKWFIKKREADYSLIARQFQISEILAKLSVNRNISSNKEMEEYLHPSLTALHDPKEMKDLDATVKLLVSKIQQNKTIRIVGDYDVDGVMSTYILYSGLCRCGAAVDYEIPERIKDGYGVNIHILEAAYNENINTIITCDNGIAAIDQVAYAKEKGMTVLITDHHDIPYEEVDEVRKEKLPQADRIVNPKQSDCGYPFEGICGAVVAWKVITRLYEYMNIPKEEAYEFLEYAAIATVCDVMDLVDENRVIVKFGLERINQTKNIGLRALIEEAGIGDKKIGVYHLGFILGPCINASGRLESAKMSLSLLLCKEKAKAKLMATEIKQLNDERKDMTNEGLEEAIRIVESNHMEQDKVLVIYLPACHESLAGIIAGRIKERYNRPTIVLCDGKEGVKGSARSIEAYNMFEELNRCKELMTKFGGHPMAAGLSLPKENIEPLRDRLNELATLSEDDFMMKVSFDLQLPLKDISFPLIQEISLLEPYGKGNPKPMFVLKDVHVLKANVIGKNKNVIKMMVEDGSHSRFPAMLFNMVEPLEECVIQKYGESQLNAMYGGYGSEVYLDLVFYVEINEYNGTQTIQLMIQHFR